MSAPGRIYTVYRLYDTAGELLYVGVTCNVPMRFAQHRTSKPWFPEVARSALQPFRNPEDAAAAELLALRGGRGKYNHARKAFPYTFHKQRPK